MKKILLSILLPVLLIQLGYCEEQAQNVFVNSCQAVEGKTFHSVKPLETGLSPDSVINFGYWTIVFSEGGFTWNHLDVQETGDYECNGWEIHGKALKEKYKGFYYRERNILEWDGVEYQRTVPILRKLGARQ